MWGSAEQLGAVRIVISPYARGRFVEARMTMPTACGMPPLTMNIEGLRSHAMLLNVFDLEPLVPVEMRKWRAWLVHCLVKTARHYDEARSLVLAQVDEHKRSADLSAQGHRFPVFDFALAMEDCITSLAKAIACTSALVKNGHAAGLVLLELAEERQTLNALRNQQEHMYSQVAAGQTGRGPIVLALAQEGQYIKLRDLTMSFAALHRLVEALYRDIAAFFPAHDPKSPPEARGVLTLTVSVEISDGDIDSASLLPK